MNDQINPWVRMTGITKRFGPVTVLRDVRFEVRCGEVHVLAGENGAGKSTLIKILAGVHTEFEGELEIDGRLVRPRSPHEAEALGVAVIHQELSLVPTMSVADNVFLGRPLSSPGGFVRRGAQHAQTRRLLDRFGLAHVDPGEAVDRLPIGTQQLIEIAKALNGEAHVIVMDEPTSALNAPEVERLFALIGDLKSRGCGIVYISHKMQEIERLADRITVLRDGTYIGTAPVADLPVPKLVQWMVGREMGEQFIRHVPSLGSRRLQLEGFSVHPRGINHRPAVDDIDLHVHAGEVVGLGGLEGSGNSQLMLGLFGAYGRSVIRGHILLDGEAVEVASPRRAITQGMAMLTNDRKTTGLILSQSIIVNTTLASLPAHSPGGWCRTRRELATAERLGETLGLRAASLSMSVGALSGGNQQKVALAKWLATKPKLMLLDEPTRGVDIGAKREIYELINQWTADGIAILLITSEMPELLAMSDRIYVMHRGRITAHLHGTEATADAVLEAAMGHTQETLNA